PSRGDYAAFNPRSSPMNKICPSTSSLANHLTCPFWIMCRTSYPLNRPPRTNGGSKPLARIHAPFDRAMVLFHDIVQVWTCAASAATPQFSLLLQFGDHLRVGRIAVYIDYPRTGMTRRRQGFLEEALRCGRIPVCRKREINCGACGIDRSIYVLPCPSHTNISFVHSPGTVGRFQFSAATLVELRRVALDPPPDRGVVRSKAPLNQKFLDVPIPQGEPQIP